jgi:hypothetical protein
MVRVLTFYRTNRVSGCVKVFTKVHLYRTVVMIPNLIDATNQYWRKLDELEGAYQRGEVSLEEVDAKVATLMAELGEERRASVRFLLDNVSRIWQEQRELVVGLALVGVLTYTWIVVS